MVKSKYQESIPSAMSIADTKQQRLPYIDNIRWLMIFFVIVVHSAVIYGPVGQFFGFEDRTGDLGPTEFLLALNNILLQTFFMGILFLIAGYFVPSSLARKGRKKFIWDRFKRLGIPALIFMLFLAPLINYPTRLATEMSFAEFAIEYYPNPIRWDSGPMWFAIALLMFSIAWTFKPASWTFSSLKGPLTRSRVAFLIAMITVITFLVRIPFPVETDVWNMQLCFFTQYVALFIVGVAAYHYGWLSTLSSRDGRFFMIVATVSVFVLMFPLLIFGGALDGDLSAYNGGPTWQAFGYALFEQVFGISVCVCILVWWRERNNKQGWLQKKLSDNAFAMYVFHPPVVIGIANVMLGTSLPGALKFVILVSSATLITFALSEYVLRRTPVLKRVL
jgi:peptidoglycan/LPS O-acetylase OafA/YrhL